MKTDNWNPGYSTNKDYPFNGIESRKLQKTDDEMSELDFLKIRLEVAEQQIEEIFHEMPFTPELFGFELIHQNKDIHEKPVRMYISKYNDAITLYQKPSNPLSDTFNPYQWVLLRKVSDTEFPEIDLVLPCHRIAYSAFYALGVKIEEAIDDKMETSAEVVEEEPKKEEKAKFTHIVDFTRDGATIGVQVTAKSKKEALTQAKFIIETDEDYNVSDVKFEELSIVPNS